MAYRYRDSRQDFILFGPQKEIRETEYGQDANRVYYPGVSTCTTLTLLLNDNTLLGAHFAKPDPTRAVDAIVTELNNLRNNRPVTQLYLLGVLRLRDSSGWMQDDRYRWPQLITTFNVAFGLTRGAMARGYVQQSGSDVHYRGDAIGNGVMAWYHKPTAVPLDQGKWEAVSLVNL